MDKQLKDLYNLKENLNSRGFSVGDDILKAIKEAEEAYIKSSLLELLKGSVGSAISMVQCPMSITIDYNPGEEPIIKVCRKNKGATEDTVDDNESDGVVLGGRRPKRKSIGFSVSFADGTVFHGRRAVDTWILALKKIGLEKIWENRSRHQAWHYVDDKDVCVVEKSETIRESGASPQKMAEGYYIMTQISNEQKVKDLQLLGEFLPDLGIKVEWDADNLSDEETIKSPVINEDASHWNYPIKEQFRAFLGSIKSASTAHSYTSTLDNAVREWIKKEVDVNADSVFSYTTSEDVRLCIEMLNASADYVAENDRKHHSMSAALNQYLIFIENWEKRFKD